MIDMNELMARAVADGHPGVMIAVGRPCAGMEGADIAFIDPKAVPRAGDFVYLRTGPRRACRFEAFADGVKNILGVVVATSRLHRQRFPAL